MRKDEIERAAFEEFVALAGLLVDHDSIDQPAPPAPDVVCTIRGRRRYFELTRFTDAQVEKKVNTGAVGRENVRILELSDISDVIRSKAGKKYLVDDGPIDLVIHEGARWLDSFWAYGQVGKLKKVLRNEIQNRQFARIWFVDFTSRRLVFASRPR